MPTSVWDRLVSPLNQDEIQESVQDSDWQTLRHLLKGTDLAWRYRCLKLWLQKHNHSRQAVVQVSNYVNALKRGGMIR